jgi:hypothetical protein
MNIIAAGAFLVDGSYHSGPKGFLIQALLSIEQPQTKKGWRAFPFLVFASFVHTTFKRNAGTSKKVPFTLMNDRLIENEEFCCQ